MSGQFVVIVNSTFGKVWKSQTKEGDTCFTRLAQRDVLSQHTSSLIDKDGPANRACQPARLEKSALDFVRRTKGMEERGPVSRLIYK